MNARILNDIAKVRQRREADHRAARRHDLGDMVEVVEAFHQRPDAVLPMVVALRPIDDVTHEIEVVAWPGDETVIVFGDMGSSATLPVNVADRRALCHLRARRLIERVYGAAAERDFNGLKP